MLFQGIFKISSLCSASAKFSMSPSLSNFLPIFLCWYIAIALLVVLCCAWTYIRPPRILGVSNSAPFDDRHIDKKDSKIKK